MCSPSGDTNDCEVHVVDVVPVLHHVEAREQIDVFLLRGGGDQLDHVRGFRLGDHLRRELRIDQNDVGAGRADLVEADCGSTRRDRRARGRGSPNWCRAARAPGRAWRRRRPASKRLSMSATSSPLTPRLITVIGVAGETLRELGLQPARISRGRRLSAGARGRRRADGDDGDRLAGRQFLRDARQRIGEADEIERRVAGARCFGARGERQSDSRQRARRQRCALSPEGEIDVPHGSFPPLSLTAALGLRFALAWPPRSRDRPAVALCNHELARRCQVFLSRRIQVECPKVGPELHDLESVEQRHFLLQCNPTHDFGISPKRDHRFRARTVLRID